MATDKKELLAISLVGECNSCHTGFVRAGNESLNFALQAGALLHKMKANIEHGQWQAFAEQYFKFSLRVAQRYMKMHNDLGTLSKATRASLLENEDSIQGVIASVSKANKPATQKPKPTPSEPLTVDAVSVTPTKPKPPSVRATRVLDEAGIEPTPEQAAALAQYDADSQVELAKNVASGAQDLATAVETGEIVDLGECPVCNGAKWSDDGTGLACSKCHHPHGEPAGDPDERACKEAKTMCIRTIEAAQRAFDDLAAKCVFQEYKEGVEALKVALRIAKAWKVT